MRLKEVIFIPEVDLRIDVLDKHFSTHANITKYLVFINNAPASITSKQLQDFRILAKSFEVVPS